MDAVATGLTALTIRVAPLAYDVVSEVLPATGGCWSSPLQIYRGLIHIGNKVLRSRWGLYKKTILEKETQFRDIMTKYAHDLCFISATVMSGSFRNKQNRIMTVAEIDLKIHPWQENLQWQTNTHPHTHPFIATAGR